MKRGGPLKRKTALVNTKPMQRTGTLRTASATKTAKARPVPREIKPAKAPRGMRTRGPRMTPIRKSARGEECTVLIPGVCNRDPSTTVLCHSNRLADGKGMGLKAPDTEACYGCSACHDVLDGRRPLPGWMTRAQLDHVFDRARQITHERLRQKGLMA